MELRPSLGGLLSSQDVLAVRCRTEGKILVAAEAAANNSVDFSSYFAEA